MSIATNNSNPRPPAERYVKGSGSGLLALDPQNPLLPFSTFPTSLRQIRSGFPAFALKPHPDDRCLINLEEVSLC